MQKKTKTNITECGSWRKKRKKGRRIKNSVTIVKDGMVVGGKQGKWIEG